MMNMHATENRRCRSIVRSLCPSCACFFVRPFCVRACDPSVTQLPQRRGPSNLQLNVMKDVTGLAEFPGDYRNGVTPGAVLWDNFSEEQKLQKRGV